MFLVKIAVLGQKRCFMAIMAKMAFLSNYGQKSPPPIVIFLEGFPALILKLIYRVTYILKRSENF